MGDLTRAELREEVVLNLGNRREYSDDDNSTAEYQSLSRAFDRGQTAIARTHPDSWRQLRRTDRKIISIDGTVAGNDYFYSDFPSEFHKLLGVIVQQTGVSASTTLNATANLGAVAIVIASTTTGVSEGQWVLITLDDATVHRAQVTLVGGVVLGIPNHTLPSIATSGNLVEILSNEEPAYKMIQLPREQWDFIIGENRSHETANRSRFYTVDQDSTGTYRIFIYPIPDINYTLFRRYTVWPTDFTGESDTGALAKLDDAMIAYATAYEFRRLQQFDEETRWFQTYQTLVHLAIQDDMMQPDVQYTHMGYGVRNMSDFSSVNYWQDPFVRSNR